MKINFLLSLICMALYIPAIYGMDKITKQDKWKEIAEKRKEKKQQRMNKVTHTDIEKTIEETTGSCKTEVIYPESFFENLNKLFSGKQDQPEDNGLRISIKTEKETNTVIAIKYGQMAPLRKVNN